MSLVEEYVWVGWNGEKMQRENFHLENGQPLTFLYAFFEKNKVENIHGECSCIRVDRLSPSSSMIHLHGEFVRPQNLGD
jgi:hypothetical protein